MHSVTLHQSDTGRQSCIDAGVPLALTAMACELSVKSNDNNEAIWQISDALEELSKSDNGMRACVSALTTLMTETHVKENE
jgi:hypothetical protein